MFSTKQKKTIGIAGLLGMALLGSGCGGIDFGSGSGGSASAYAPRITSSFPEPGSQTLVEGGSITFSAAGSDDDSLRLDWTWALDDEISALGSEEDGSFDTSWQLSWDGAWSGATLVVSFQVTDGEYDAELSWPVDVP